MKILFTICARGGSKGIPDKNIKILAGKPLIYYSLHTAVKFSEIKDSDIFLSTDSSAIKEIVDGLEFKNVCTEYQRPAHLANDTAGKIDAIIDVKNFAEKTNSVSYDYIIDLDVTSPLRTTEDLLNALEIFKLSKAHNIFSVSPANRNPYFNMVEEKEDGFFTLSKVKEVFSRQTAPKVYDMNASFYIYKPSFFEKGFKSAVTPKSLIYEVPHVCFDLDHQIDFDFMEYLFEFNKLDFKI